jgi:hypothetical protein
MGRTDVETTAKWLILLQERKELFWMLKMPILLRQRTGPFKDEAQTALFEPQFVPRSKQFSAPLKKTNQFML